MSSLLTPGVPVEIGPYVRRLLAPNAGLMTGPGTNTYLVGNKEIAVIDPGPRSTEHIAAIQDACAGRLRWILVTHTHPDHSPGASVLAAATGATLLGRPAPAGRHQDQTFVADRVLEDGDLLQTDEFKLQAIHTPGHASNHICYRLGELRWLFTGDHIMNGSTVVIDPPDGDMKDYLESLARLKTLDLSALAPGHGLLIDKPSETIDWLIAHRLKREAKLTTCLQQHPHTTIEALTKLVYDEVAESLHGLAQRSLLAHLLKLQKEQRARVDDDRWQLIGEVGEATT